VILLKTSFPRDIGLVKSGDVMATEQQLKQDIHGIDKRMIAIETILVRLETNHLSHIETSMAKMEGRMEKIDNRLWVGSIAFMGQIALILLGAVGFLLSKVI
jgi:hypothetical protein